MSDNENNLELDKDVMYLDGYFFLTSKTIQDNTETVKKAFQDIYQHVCLN